MVLPGLIRSEPLIRLVQEYRAQLQAMERALVPDDRAIRVVQRVIQDLEAALNDSAQGRPWLQASEVETYIPGENQQKVRRKCRNNEIPGARLEGRRWLIPRTWVDGRRAQ